MFQVKIRVLISYLYKLYAKWQSWIHGFKLLIASADWYFAKDDIFIDMTTVTKIVEEWCSQLNIGECLSPNYFYQSTGVSQSKSTFKEFWVIECQYQKQSTSQDIAELKS